MKDAYAAISAIQGMVNALTDLIVQELERPTLDEDKIDGLTLVLRDIEFKLEESIGSLSISE